MKLKIENLKTKITSGFTLIEGLVTILITSMLLLAIFQLIDYSIKVTADNKNRVVATVIAEQQLEMIRSLPYSSVGTVGGLITGTIPDNQVIVRGTDNYNVNILIKYADDPYDGTLVAGTDSLPTDYKTIDIRVSWSGSMGSKSIATSTIVSPRGLETSDGGGALEILVFDANGTPISSADVHIENNLLSPVINFDDQTDSSGKLILYGAPVSVSGYEISVSNGNDYSKSSTSPVTIANPVPTIPHASVYEDTKTDISFSIDRLADLTIKTVSATLPNNWAISTYSESGDQTNPAMSIDGSGNFYFVWEDDRVGSNGKIYGQKYDDTKNNVWPDDDITIETANNRSNPVIVSDLAGNQYIAWDDGSTGNRDVYYVKYGPGGTELWGGAKKLNTEAGSKDQTNPKIALTEFGTNSTSTVVWQDNRANNLDIYAQKYYEDGEPVWIDGTKERLINSDGTNTDQYDPQVVTDTDDNIYIVWTDERNGNQDIYAQKYNQDGEKQWLNDIQVNNNSSENQYSPAIAIDSSNNLYITWTDERNVNKDIFAQKIDENGVRDVIWNDNKKINTDSTTTNQSESSIAINNTGDIYIAWTDERNGDEDIYAQKYDTNGNPIWPTDTRININTGNSSQSDPQITINPTDGTAYVTWNDNRNGEFDVFASPIEPYGISTNIVSVPVQVTGDKQIGDNPIIYKYNNVHTSNASGTILLNDIEWDIYTLALQAGYTDYEIIMTSLPNPLELNPTDNIEIILYLE